MCTVCTHELMNIHSHHVHVYEGASLGRRGLQRFMSRSCPSHPCEYVGPPSRAGAAFGSPACCGFREHILSAARRGGGSLVEWNRQVSEGWW